MPHREIAMKVDLEKVRVIDLKPGDVLVLRHPLRLSLPAQSNIRASMRKVFPDNECVILEESLTLDAFRKVEALAPAKETTTKGARRRKDTDDAED